MKSKIFDDIDICINVRGERILTDDKYITLQKLISGVCFDEQTIEYLNNFSKRHKELLRMGIKK